jgi:inorganic pyrophosphatase
MKGRGLNDYKVLGVPNTDPLFAEYKDLEDVAGHYLREVEHFFATYKQLEGVHTEPQGWDNAAAAISEVRGSIERHMRSMTDGLLGMRL